VLETDGIEPDEALLEGWRARAERARAHLGWPVPGTRARRHARGASLAVAAPSDQLYVATEVNEWALCATLFARSPSRWAALEPLLLAAALDNAADGESVIPPLLEERAAFERFTRLASAEAQPALRALLAAAAARELPYLLDDDTLTLGSGAGGRDFPRAALPAAAEVPWGELSGVPTALVTGSNGKTTTVRLLAACARAHGWHAAYSCTDGVFLDREPLAAGDYSGPAGARRVLRERRAQAALIETARGGILRRGIAVSSAAAAVVTNVSADHFGEYGVDHLEALADVKLTVAAVLGERGLLVLNADDALLRVRATRLGERFGRSPPCGWFALEDEAAPLAAHRARGGATCGVRDGRLRLTAFGAAHDLGAVAAMPLTVEGSATYNIANLAAAALAAAALGIPPATIALTFARFGSDPQDNHGRLMRFELDGVRVLIDYAHNPEGLRGLLAVAQHLRAGRGRLGLILGHAGNRQDADIEALAQVAAAARPQLIVVKENEAHLRGREPGEIPRLLRAGLLRAGLEEATLPQRGSELEAVRCALEWARPGDVLVLPVHSAAARAAVLELINARSAHYSRSR
jgi:cyanophycin synthetase